MLQKIVANFVWSYDKLHKISLGVFITKKSNLKMLWKRTRGLTLVKMPLVIKGFERRGRVLLPKGGAAKREKKFPRQSLRLAISWSFRKTEQKRGKTVDPDKTAQIGGPRLPLLQGTDVWVKCWFMQLATLVEEKCTFSRNPVPLYLFLLLCKLLDSETAASAVLRFRTQ